MSLYHRQPYQPEDLESLFDLVRSRPVQRVWDFPSLADLRELLYSPVHAAVWRDRGQETAAYCILLEGDTYASLVFETRGAEIQLLEEVIAWGVETCAVFYTGAADALNAGAGEAQTARIAALERQGFIRLPENGVRMERDLRAPIPSAALPTGYGLRGSRGEDESAAWVALHRAAFGTQNMTLDDRQAMLSQPDYDMELDLVATAPSGELAAYVFCSFDRAVIAASGLNAGFTDPVGTHPDHQRRGLAKALLLEGLRRLRQRGMDFARLSTTSANLAMQAAARSAGYHEAGCELHFARPLEREGKA
jgi:mycothiol synthase